MDELNKIIEAVATSMGISAAFLQASADPQAITARRKVCHIVANGFPHLISAVGDTFSIKREKFYTMARIEDYNLARDPDAMFTMNGLRRALSLPALKNKHLFVRSRVLSATKRLFGFDYTDGELAKMHSAMESAAAFMKRYCSLGKNPLEPGMVYTRMARGRKTSLKGQYKE